MSIPDFQSCMLPLLQYASDPVEHKFSVAVEALIDIFKLTEEEKAVLLPSGTQQLIKNRIGWAKSHLKKAGLLEDTRWGYFRITQRGKDVLSQKPEKLNMKYLRQFSEYSFKRVSSNSNQILTESVIEENNPNFTPEEALEYGYQKLTENLSDELLEQIMSCPPSFFEKLVVELLVKMGYGGSPKAAASIVGKSGDAGIDGIIKEDKLGLDAIYIQAKRWVSVVGRPEIQKFVGALDGQKARKGIFITTSSFSKEAIDYAKNTTVKVVLIDGERLAELMMENNLGVSTTMTYEIKRVDTDYFSDQQ